MASDNEQAGASTGIGVNKATPWTRLAHRLEENHEEFGPVKGELSLARIGMIWLAANLVVTTQLTGTLFVPGITWQLALGLVVAGSVAGGIVLILVGNIGTRTGLPTMSLTKGAFGLRGSYLAVVANVVILMGWSWVQAMLAGVTVDFLFSQVTGVSSPVLFSVLCQVLVVCLAIFGHEGISKVEPYLGVVILAVMAYIFGVAFTTYSITDYVTLPVDTTLGWSGIVVFDVVVATAISWTVLSAEFNRLAKSQTAGIVGCSVGYVLSTSLAMALGATAIAYVVLEGGVAEGFDPTIIVAAFGIPLAVVIFLSVMATNTLCVYGMVTSFVNMTPNRNVQFLPTALVLGAISIIGATWLALLNQFTAFLTVIGALFIPVFAIMIADYYIIHKGYYDHDILRGHGGKFWYRNGVNWPAILIWIIGAACSFFLTYIAPSPIGATVPTFFIAFGLYLGWAVSSKRIVKDKPTPAHLLAD
jgi:purine-cytosine permease-like protein